MKKMILTVVQLGDEEHREYLLDGKSLIVVNHDEHGWSGVGAVDDALRAVATIAGWEVGYVHEDEDDWGDDET